MICSPPLDLRGFGLLGVPSCARLWGPFNPRAFSEVAAPFREKEIRQPFVVLAAVLGTSTVLLSSGFCDDVEAIDRAENDE